MDGYMYVYDLTAYLVTSVVLLMNSR